MKQKSKKLKTYLTHFPVKSYIEADILSKESTWRIMDRIRQAGAKGITAEEITQQEQIPVSIVYTTLKELYRLEYVFLYPRQKKEKGERKKRFVCERGSWGKYGIDKEFDAIIKVNGITEGVMNDLRQPIMKIFDEIYEKFSSKKELHQFLPTKHSNICPNCQRSHESMEFFYAILLRSIDLMITESKQIKDFLIEKGYAYEEQI
ncbi:hypothetical protein [Candidatus Nitrosocosmicus sp. T]